MTDFDTDVLIVGAGPTGLAAATVLQQAGLSPIVVEKLAAGQNTSRAAVIHAHTLEVLDSLGVSERLLGEGVKVAWFSIRDRDRVLARLRFDRLPTRFSCLLMLPQDRTERILADALAAAGGAVRWGCAVDSVAETADGVEATVVSGVGRQTIRARYVVGADGMHSVIRESAGIGFAGARYEESFVLADVDMAWGHGRGEVALYFARSGLVVIAPLPDGRTRIVATLEDAPPQPDISDVQALLDAGGPTRGAARILKVHWSSRFRVHHRVADRYRAGRVFLVGDAAHVHSPAGGQGMNTGLVDACVLGRLLSDVVSGRRGEADLDLYESIRRPAAIQVLKLAGRLTWMATIRSAPQRFLRDVALRTISWLPPARRGLEMSLSGLSRRAAAQLPER